MAKIPWYLWIIVGAGMFIIAAKAGEKLEIFLYIAMLFVVVGVFKLLVGFILGGKTKKALLESSEIRQQHLACPRCRALIAPTYEFCPHCGTKIRY